MKFKNILLPLFSLLSFYLHADTCFRSFDIDNSKSHAIFIGTVVKSDIFWIRGYPETFYTFKISKSYKGFQSENGYISILDPMGGCCGVGFKKDSVYLVFSYSSGYPNILYTNDCSNSGLLTESKEILKQLKDPFIHPDTPKYYEVMKKEIQKDTLENYVVKLESRIDEAESSIFNYQLALTLILILTMLLIGVFVLKNKKQGL